MSDTTPQHTNPDESGTTATLPDPAPAAPRYPEAADRGGVTLPSKVKNAIVVGGIGIAVLGGLLGFGAGYIVGDSSSGNTNQMNGPGNWGVPGGMNGQTGPGGMNGQTGPGGPNGQIPNGQMPNGQQGQVPTGQPGNQQS